MAWFITAIQSTNSTEHLLNNIEKEYAQLVTKSAFADLSVSEETRLTTLERRLPECHTRLKIYSRTFGFSDDYLSARRYIHKNIGDMHECIYDYLVLEEINEGIHSQVESEIWFKWENDRWVALNEKPKQFQHLVNFSIG